MNVCIVGTGYVGLVTGASLAFFGHKVSCYDIDRKKVSSLSEGRVPFYEPYLDELVRDQAANRRLIFSHDLEPCVEEADVIFISVATPSCLNNCAVNLQYVEQAAVSIGQHLKPGRFYVIVNKSTVPVGSNGLVERLVSRGIKKRGLSDIDFATASNPEFLREGNAVYDVFYPDRIVVGSSSKKAIMILRELYTPLLEQDFVPPPYIMSRPEGFSAVPLISVDPVSAELIKYAANAFLATKITFINEIANICDLVGADVKHVARGIGLDKRIGKHFLNAGLGWGGSCFGKDLKGLISDVREYDYEPKLLSSILEVNYRQRMMPVKKLQELLKTLRGKTIGIMGLSFKPNTDDMRDAPSVEIIEKLLDMGASVQVYDPVAMETFKKIKPDLKVRYARDGYDVAENADGLILVTEWEHFTRLDWKAISGKMRNKAIVDGRNVLDRECLEEIGFEYRGIGIS